MESFEDNCKVQENEMIINADALNGLDRFFTRGTYASKFGLFSLGHVGVVHGLDDEDLTPWMDEHAVRIRAGIMHIFSWMSFINIMFVKDPRYAWVVMSIASWEFLSSSFFGLTPISPVGCIATLVSMRLYKEPLWTPAKPKRFSWMLGLFVVGTCLGLWRYAHVADEMDRYAPYLQGLALSCIVLTWLESACGFCLGCYAYNGFKFVSPEDAQLSACTVCQVRISNNHASALSTNAKIIP